MRKYTITKKQMEILKRCNFMYKQIGRKWWLCRMYGNKEAHPFLYHILVLEHIEVKEQESEG